MLAGLVTEVAAGRGRSVLIEGEPGIGKSALVRAALDRAADAGCQIFWGAGDELGQALPLLPLLDALRVREPSANPRRNSIVRLLRGEVIADRGTDVSVAVGEQFLGAISEKRRGGPPSTGIDTTPWADAARIPPSGAPAPHVPQ